MNPINSKRKHGAKIDLLPDRKNRSINICEMKFATDEFIITKKYPEELIQKQTVIVDKIKTKKIPTGLCQHLICRHGYKRKFYGSKSNNIHLILSV